MRRVAAPSAAALLFLTALTAGPATAEVTWQRRVGADFEHFGEEYRLTEDQDTVTVFNDYGSVAGLRVFSSPREPTRLCADLEAHLGRETTRLRLDMDGRWARGAHTLELDQEASWRTFRDDGNYSISSDSVEERLLVGWERELAGRWRLRARNVFEGTWYASPDEYNLDGTTWEPRGELRMRLRDFDELRLGGRWARRTVPDSTSLGYDRTVAEAGASFLFGWTSSVDLSAALERRDYDEVSVRESFWETRGDGRLEFAGGDRATFRLLHENLFVRYDEPDELDFDSDWTRTGFQVELHPSGNVDFSLMPLLAVLRSDTAPEEEYSESALEAGVDIRVGRHTWISLTDEIGWRDYEVAATEVPGDVVGTAASDDLLGSAYSDYAYHRLTVLVTSDVSQGVSVNLFANWQPEDHRQNRHDTESRIVSGGVEYRF